MTELELELENAMRNIYERCVAEIGTYRPTVFLDMIGDRGGVGTVRYLILEENLSDSYPSDGYPSYGFGRLHKAGEASKGGRLDLSLEALIVENPQFHSLFGDDKEEIVEKATKRLHDYSYKPKVSA